MRTPRRPMDPDISLVAALLAEPSRLAILFALSDGRALPAGELARSATVSAATASEHLAKLTAAGLVDVVSQGRHRYFRIAGEHVATAIEGLIAIAPGTRPLTTQQSRLGRELRSARLCFGHLAGALGVAFARRLVGHGALSWSDAGYCVTTEGWQWLSDLGVDAGATRSRKPAIRTCHVDWSERRPHMSGPFAVTLTRWLLDGGYLSSVRESRAVRVTARGQSLLTRLGVEWPPTEAAPR